MINVLMDVDLFLVAPEEEADQITDSSAGKSTSE